MAQTPDLAFKGPVRRIRIPINSVSDYVTLLNGIFKLTDMEIRVISELISRVKKDIEAFSPLAKISIAKKLDIKSIDSYIRKLLSKDALRKEGSVYTINALLLPGKHRHILFDLDLNSERR
tara:strand:- start:256 stop:618 length:363 start_codon:yes stop_codon:yes gene_type:complete